MTDRLAARTERRDHYPHRGAVALAPTDNGADGRTSSPACCGCFERLVDAIVATPEIADQGIVAYTFEVACRFHRAFGFPDAVSAGLRVVELGASVVRFELGLFRGDEDKPVATGHVVRVFVARDGGKPAPVPAALRVRLAGLLA